MNWDPGSKRQLARKDVPAYLLERYGLHYSVATLANYAASGVGPAYRRFSKFAYYEKNDLDTWAEERISQRVRKASDLHLKKNGCVGPEIRAAETSTHDVAVTVHKSRSGINSRAALAIIKNLHDDDDVDADERDAT